VTLNQREQWRGIPKGNLGSQPSGYRTSSITGEYGSPCALGTKTVALGSALTLFRDGAGQAPLVTLGAGLAGSFAYRIKYSRRPDKWSIQARLGWQASFMQKKLSGDYFIYSDQLNPYYGLISDPTQLGVSSGGFFNHNAGVMLRFSKGSFTNLTGGFSVSNLFSPNQSLYDRMGDTFLLPRRLSLHAGGNFPIIKGLFLTPQGRWDRQANGQLNFFTFGAYLQNHKFYGGLFYSTSTRHFSAENSISNSASRGVPSLNASFGVDIYEYWPGLDRLKKGQRLILGLSYDGSLKNLNLGNTRGGLEVNFRLNFFDAAKNSCESSIDTRRCPVL